MTDWGQLFLGIIAGATLVMALMQIGALIVAAKVARQAQAAVGQAQATLATAQQMMTSVRQDVQPLLQKAHAIADEAAKSAAIATAQAQKVDQLVTDLARRVDDTSAIVQQAIITPAREGLAIVAAIRTVFATLRGGVDWRRRRPTRSEEEDPLFIG